MVDHMAVIVIKLRTDGRIDMRSTFMGRVDVSAYAPFAQERLVAEVEKLARELREQMVQELRTQLLVNEAVLPSRG